MNINEQVMGGLHDVLSIKFPTMTGIPLKTKVQYMYNRILKDIKNFDNWNKTIDAVIDNPNIKDIGVILAEIYKGLNVNPAETSEPQHSDFEKHFYAFVHTTFWKPTENGERILDQKELSQYSYYLANNRVCEYKFDSDHYSHRFLKKEEYNEISNARASLGFGVLDDYASVKIFSADFVINDAMPDSKRTISLIETVKSNMAHVVSAANDDTYDESEPEF